MSAWREVPLGELGVEVRETVAPEPGVVYAHYSVPAFAKGTPSMDDGEVIKSNKRLLHPGDVLICRINPRINRVWLVGQHAEPTIGSTEWVILRVSEPALVDRRFLVWYLRSPQFRTDITSAVSGVTGSHTRANPKHVLSYPVPVPGFDEQRAVVDAIEQMLSYFRAARRSATRAARRLAQLESSFLESMMREARVMGEMVSLEDMWHTARYGTSERCAVDGTGVPVLRIPNVRGRRIDLADIKRVVNDDADVTNAMVSPGDVLIIRTNGSRSLIGRTAQVTELPEPFACASYIIRLRFDTGRVRPAFVAAALEAPSVRSVLERRAASSAGQYNLSVAKLKGVVLPVPSLVVQDRLLSRLAAHESTFGRLRASVELLDDRADMLQRSILKAAFAGRLTGGAELPQSVEDFDEAMA